MRWTIINTEGNWKKHLIIVLIGLSIVTILAIIAERFFVTSNSLVAESPSWLDAAWTQQSAVTIDNGANGSTLTNYQVSATIDTASLITAGTMKNDCSDLRITSSDGTTQLNFWIVDSTCNTATTQIWIKVPSITASTTTTLYIYYGNPAATSLSSWDNTILPYSDTQLATNATGLRDQAGMLSYNGKLWMLGGAKSNALGDRINDVWSSTDGVSWTQVTDHAGWSARTSFGYVVFDNKMWVYGGSLDGNVKLNDVWSSTDGITWTQATASAGWSARSGFGFGVLNSKMWVYGGRTASANLNDVWSSTDGITWTQATASAAWGIRQAMGSTVFNGKLWMFGGLTTASGNVSEVWSSSDGITWTEPTSAAAWSVRNNTRAEVFDNRMWIAGGFGSAQTNDLWYSSDGITWTAATTSGNWHIRTIHNMTAWNDRLIIANGAHSVGGNFFLSDVWQLMRTYTTPAPTVASVLAAIPAAPSSLTAGTLGTDRTTLTWTDNSHIETGFEIKKSTDGVTYASVSTVAANTATAVITGLTPNTQYWLEVFATGPSTGTTPSISEPITTLATVPTIQARADSDTQIYISWSSTGSQWYAENTTTGVNSGWTTRTSYSFPGLTCGTSYSVRVKGKNSAGVETAFSDSVNTSTNSCTQVAYAVTAAPSAPSVENINGAIAISGGNETHSPNIKLNFNSTGATQMILSEDPNFKNAYWETYKPTTVFYLSGGFGEKTIYVMFGSTTNLTSQKYQTSVTLKELPKEIVPETTPTTVPSVTTTATINPSSRINTHPIKEKSYQPSSSVDYTYQYRNKNSEPVQVKIVRQVVDSSGKTISTVNNRMVIKKGQTVIKTAKNYLNNELNGTYQIRIKIIDLKTSKVLDENGFSIEVQ